MASFNVLQDIAERTGGCIYVGVVGPVRTGKSTFIKRFMDLMVLPRIKNNYDRQRTQDELPQSGAGRTIMTTQPRFVPDEAVEITMSDGLQAKVRMVDCVGYPVEGALGFEEEDGPRLVRTPWFDDQIPFEQAAEVGTEKVIKEHSTIGLVITTDGSITEIPRENYLPAERRVISELKELDKPFLVVLNSTNPEGEACRQLAEELAAEYGVAVKPMDCLNMEQDDILDLFEQLLMEFPVREIGVDFPSWIVALPPDYDLRRQYTEAAAEAVEPVFRMRDVPAVAERLGAHELVEGAELTKFDAGSGSAVVTLKVANGLYYDVLSELSGYEVGSEADLLVLFQQLAEAKRQYDRLSDALEEVYDGGYGVVPPDLSEIVFEEPELIRQGNRFGVKLKAHAPSIHMVRANIVTEVTPFVGTERQGEELVRYLSDEFEKDPDRIWKSDFLGKSLQDLLQESINTKLNRLPENAREKLQETLTKIINEGSGGLICIIL